MTQGSSSNDQFSVSTGSDATTTGGVTGATQPITTGATTSSTGSYGGTSSTSSYGSSTQGTVDQVKEKAGDLTDQAKQQAGQLADQAKQQVTTRLGTQKDRAAEGLGSMADALRQTGQQLRQNDQSGITQYVDQAADQVERLSGYLQNRDLPEILDEVERFARRQPTLFLGGAFVLGLIGARFLKSSSSNSGRGNYPIVPRDQYTSRMYSNYTDSTMNRGTSGATGGYYGSDAGLTSGTSYGGGTGYSGGTTSGISGGTGYSGGTTSGMGGTTSGMGSLGGTTSDTSSTGSSGSTSSSRELGGTEGL